MTKEETLFHSIARGMPDVTVGKTFGALCIKTPAGKSGVVLWKNDLIVKLEGEMKQMALALHGAQLFDPMGGRPMKEWVQIPAAHSDKWKLFSTEAMEYVRNIRVMKIPKKTKTRNDVE